MKKSILILGIVTLLGSAAIPNAHAGKTVVIKSSPGYVIEAGRPVQRVVYFPPDGRNYYMVNGNRVYTTTYYKTLPPQYAAPVVVQPVRRRPSVVFHW